MIAAVLAVLALSADPTVLSFKSDSSGQLRPKVKSSGDFLRSISWSDANGDMIAVFSTKTVSKAKGEQLIHTKTIWVDLYGGKDAKMKRLRGVTEVVKKCEFDATNEFLDTAVTVTDLDGNGTGELTFAYRAGCRSDVSPLDMKLLVLEGSKKYILRGKTRVKPGPEGFVGGEFEADFKGAPESFLVHATKVWDRFKDE